MIVEDFSIELDGQFTVRIATNEQEFEATGENLSDALSELSAYLKEEGL